MNLVWNKCRRRTAIAGTRGKEGKEGPVKDIPLFIFAVCAVLLLACGVWLVVQIVEAVAGGVA
jgi:hypothetical protein